MSLVVISFTVMLSSDVMGFSSGFVMLGRLGVLFFCHNNFFEPEWYAVIEA